MCRECNEIFFDNLLDMDESRSVTKRLVNWIQEASLDKTFTSVAEEIGIDEKNVRNIFNEYVTELESQTDFRTPKWLGIDEVHLLKNYRCVITDVENKSVIDILIKRKKDTVISYLSKLQDVDKIELVAMDMWNPYKSALNSVIPHAEIIIDKFHVVKLANRALEKMRNANRENVSFKERRQFMRDRYVLLTRRKDLTDFGDQIKLQVWTKNFPLLGQAYELKERFYDIYETKSINEAYELYRNWLADVPKELITYFEDLIKAVNNWEEEIFICFNSPITNAYTESLNHLIKTMNHVGRGYSFEALRAKILFTQVSRKVKKKKKPKEVEVTFGKMLSDQLPIGHKLAMNGCKKKSMVLIFLHYFPITRIFKNLCYCMNKVLLQA